MKIVLELEEGCHKSLDIDDFLMLPDIDCVTCTPTKYQIWGMQFQRKAVSFDQLQQPQQHCQPVDFHMAHPGA